MLRRIFDKLRPPIEGTDTAPLSTTETQLEAKKAVRKSKKAASAATKSEARVKELVVALEQQRDRNHFGELIEITMRGQG